MPKKSANGVHQDPPAADAKKRNGAGNKKQSKNKKSQSKASEEKTHFGPQDLEIIPPTVMGRPTKYDPKYCDDVLNWGALGKSRTWMAAAIGVDRDTIDNWAGKFPDFFGALSRAKDLEQAFWEDLGQDNMTRPHFSQGQALPAALILVRLVPRRSC